MPDLGANGPLIASLLQGQRQDYYNPFAQQRKFGQDLIVKGSSTQPLQSGHWLEGLARALQGGLGGFTTGWANQQEDEQNKSDIGLMSEAAKIAATNPTGAADLLRGLKGNNGETRAVLGQLLQGAFSTGIANQQAGVGITRGGYGAPAAPAAPGGQPGTPLTIDINRQAPPGASDNNIMNIRASGQPWEGKGAPQSGFETFNTPQAGANATAQNFAAYVKENPNITVAQAIAKWAPPTENNTAAYISQVAETTGINPGQPLAQVMQNPVEFARLMEAGTAKEKGGIPQGVTSDVLVNAGQRVAGGQPQAPQGPQMAQAGGPQPSSAPPQSIEAAQLRARADQLKANGANVEALALYKQADQIAGKFSDTATLKGYEKNLGQGQETTQNEAKLREQFHNEQAVKDYRKANSVFRSAVDAGKTDTPAADLNMIYAFATLMDPGSVVREGEMSMVKGTQTIGDVVRSLSSYVEGGSRLSPKARGELLDMMASRYGSYKGAFDSIASSYGGIADRSGMNRANITVPHPEVDYTPSKTKKPTPKPGETGGVVRGDINGNPL